MPVHVLYHGGCPDGFGSAYAVWKRYGYSAFYTPVGYDEDPSIKLATVRNADVYLVDFCYPIEWLRKLKQQGCIVYICDHHISHKDTIEEFFFNGEGGGRFDLNKSGAVLTWEFIHGTKKIPKLLEYVQDRDLWKFELDHTHEVSAALWSYPQEFEVWDRLSSRLSTLKAEGTVLLRDKHQTVARAVKQAHFRVIGGMLTPTVNTATHFSDIAHELLQKYPDSPISAYYFDISNGRRWGLRGREGGVDVSQVAAQYGGGGHRAAAGFFENYEGEHIGQPVRNIIPK